MENQPKQPATGNAEEGGWADFWGDIDSPEDDAWADVIWRRMLEREKSKPGAKPE